MMNFINQYRTAIGFIVVVVLLYFAYSFFFGGSSGDALTVTTETQNTDDQELVALLFQLKGIRLDDAIFSDKLFTSLSDFGKSLVDEPVGRQNPFAPLDGSATISIKKAP